MYSLIALKAKISFTGLASGACQSWSFLEAVGGNSYYFPVVSGSFLSFLAWSLFPRVQRTSANLCCYRPLTAFPVTYNWLPSLHWQGFQDSVTPIHITWDDTPSQNLSLGPICKIPLDVKGDRFRNEKIHVFRTCYPVSHTYLKHDLSTDLSLGHSHAVLTWEGDGYGMKTSILVLLSVELRN